MTQTALVLAGHGSHISPNTAGAIWSLVDRLRQLGAADEITAAFWKEMPSFQAVLDTLDAVDITVISMFTAQGYFSEQVIPAEMGLSGDVTRYGERAIRYRRLSSHGALGLVVQRRVKDALKNMDLTADQVAIAIIGHSTRRSPSSRQAAETQAKQIAALGLAREVAAVFLDDVPDIPSVYRLTSAPVIIAVPYFLASGSHTQIDVPRALGLAEGVSDGSVNGRRVIYTPPVGDEPDLLNAVIDLYGRAAPLPARNSAEDAWAHFPARGRDDLIAAVREQGELTFGQLRLTLNSVQVEGDSAPDKAITTPADLRRIVREHPFRPLATARTLHGGWHVPLAAPHQLHAAVETIYPGAAAVWAASRRGEFIPNTFEQTIARQLGDYRTLAALTPAQRAAVTERVCGACVCHPSWWQGAARDGSIPCPEPCNMWLSLALGEQS